MTIGSGKKTPTRRFERSGGSTASLGRVSRIYRPLATDPANGLRGKSSGNDGESFTPLKFEWNSTWIATLVLLGLVVLVIGFGFLSWMAKEARRQAQAATNSRERVAEPVVSEPPSEQAALALVKRALNVRDAAGVERYFHHRQASPEAVIGFLTKMDDASSGATRKLKWLGNMDMAGQRVEGVKLTISENGKIAERLLLLTENSPGVWKIDFEALARPVDPPWERLLDGSVREVQAYVLIERDYYTYYNGPFADEAQWACYGLFLPDREEKMFGYCLRDSPQHRAIDRILRVDGDPLEIPGLARAVVIVRRHEGGDQRQFEIVRVPAGDWLPGDVPFDGQGE